MAVNIGPKIGIEGEAEYRKQINSIIQQSKTLASEMKALTSSFDKNNKSLSDNAKQHKLLQDQIKNQEKRVQELSSMLDKSKEKFGENSDKTMKWRQAVAEAEAELNNLKSQLNSLPSSLDMVAAKMDAMGQKLQSIGNSMVSVGRTMTTAVTAPIVAAATKAVSSFAEVDKTMTLTNATMANTAEQAALLEDAMNKAAANSTFAMSDAANATLNFARAGLSAEQAASALAPAMNLAAGEAGDLDTVSGGLVATINGFGDSFDKAEYYADIFASACNNSALDVNSLSESMSIAAPVFHAAGYEVQDAALYMGVMANAGIEASEAANSLKTGFSRLISPAKEGSTWLDKFGWSVTNADGSMKDSLTIQSELHDEFAKLSEAEQIAAASAIFGKNQMSKWLALINTAPSDVAALNIELSKSAGTTQSMADAMMGGFGGSIEKLKSSLDVLMVSFGKLAAQYLTPLIEKIQKAVDAFLEMDDATKDQIVRFAAIAAAIGPLLMVGGKLVGTIGKIMSFAPKIATLLQGMSGIFSGLATTAAGALAPIAAVVAIIGILVAAFVHLWNTNEEFRTNITETWNNIKASFAGFVAQIQERLPMIQQTFQNIAEAIKPIWEGLCAILAPIFEGAFQSIAAVLDALFGAIVSVLDMIMGVLNGDKELFMQGLVTFLTTLQTFITTWWTLFWNLIVNVINVVLAFFGTSLEELLTNIKTFFTNLLELVLEKVTELKDFVIEKFEEVCEFISSLPGRFYQWGVDMIQNLIDGINSMIGALVDCVMSVADAIAGFLHFSEPDVGPLSHFNDWMPDMMKQMAEQIEAGRAGVKVAVGHVAADIAAPMAGGNTITLNNSFTFGSSYTEADGRTIARQINRQLGALYI